MASNKHLLDVATRHQVYLERLKSGEVSNLEPALARIEKAIIQVLSGIESNKLNELTRAKLKEVLYDLRAAQSQVMLDILDKIMPSLEKVAGYEAEFESKSLAQIVADVSIIYVPAKKAFAAALAQPLSANGKMLESFIKGWSEGEIEAVNNLVSKGYADGWTNQQLIQAVRGTRQGGYKDGIIAKIGNNADAVVRTAVQHVASTARMETWAANSDVVIGYRWVSTLDGHTTQVCRSLDGQVFKLGEGPRPPIHIRCRSATVAELDKRFDFLNEGETRSSKDGYVDGGLSYYDWLKLQPASFQDSAIGPTRGKLLRDGGLTAEKFARLNLGRNFKPLTLEEMRALEPAAFEKAGV